MPLQQKLQDDLKEAMRSGDSVRKSVIRYLRADIHNKELASQTSLDDDGVIDVLSRHAQQRRDSIEAFRKGNRQDLVDKEEAELALVLEYLPEQMSKEEILVLAQQAIEELGASGPQDMGKVMGRVMPQVKGKAEGRKVSEAVSDMLKGLSG